MKILVFNTGSSSLKYRLLEMPAERELAGGEAQRVGPATSKPSCILHRVNGELNTHTLPLPDQAAAFEGIMDLLRRDAALIPDALGHRFVHGGERIEKHVLIDEEILAALDSTAELAPIHNPPAINLIKTCHALYPGLPQVAVVDNAFHRTIPEHARTYALPIALQRELGIRKYGFHGISHSYVAAEAARLMGMRLDKFNAVSCHLGTGGASLCAIVGGKSVDNTMGASPLQGLVMSTRCGDIDPAIVMRLLWQHPGDIEAVETSLNRRSGILGLSGVTADLRDLLGVAPLDPQTAARFRMARDTYVWRVRKYLGAYLTVVGRVDAIIFTDTIGELSPEIRGAVCDELNWFGVRIDAARNENATTLPADIAADDSSVRVFAIATNEELAIGRATYEVLTGQAQDACCGGLP